MSGRTPQLEMKLCIVLNKCLATSPNFGKNCFSITEEEGNEQKEATVKQKRGKRAIRNVVRLSLSLPLWVTYYLIETRY